MISKSSSQISHTARDFGRFLPTLLLLLCLAGPLRAREPYLAPDQLDGVALLAPPPAPGSAEEAADLELARSVFKARTPAEAARAKHSASLSFFLFTPATGPVFQPGKLPKTEALLANVKAEIGKFINLPKDHWKRKRPYQMDETLTLGQPEPSYAYPSGHSSCGTVYGLIIAELFPDKREAIMSISRDIGWDRVLIGKHFLTDVRAGRVLGQAIVRQLMANPAFMHDLAEAKAEVVAAEQANGNAQTSQSTKAPMAEQRQSR
jgi:acid phosphatase (class A)